MANWDDYPTLTSLADGDTFLIHDVSETTVGQKMKQISHVNLFSRLYATGQSNVQQCILKAYSGQTANIQEWQNSSGGILSKVLANSSWEMNITKPTGIESTAFNGLNISYSLPSSSGDTGTNSSLRNSIMSSGASNISRVIGLNNMVYHNGTGTLALGSAIYISGGCLNTGNITNLRLIELSTYGTSSGAIGTIEGIYISSMGAYSSPTTMYAIRIASQTTAIGTSKFGINIGDVSGATNNYSLTTSSGQVIFNSSGAAEADVTMKSDNYDAVFIDTSDDSIEIMSSASGKIGFYGVTSVVRQVLATGASHTVDDVITFLQTIGLCKQS